jgi:signal transduction histidine kinase
MLIEKMIWLKPKTLWRLVLRAKRQAPYTFTAFVGVALLTLIIVVAIYDSAVSARDNSQRVYESKLSAELSNFLLSIRAPDGTTLLDNPADFSLAYRPLYPVVLRRSFFNYLLHRGNAKTFDVDKLIIELPRSCLVEFNGRASVVQACFAVVSNDTTGRYVYFAIRYQTADVRRHSAGGRLEDADRVVVLPSGGRLMPITLVYQPPSLALSRYPSQLKRFNRIHEVSAYTGSPLRPSNQIQAQAIQRSESGEAANTVTLVGRIDSGLLSSSGMTSDWPGDEIRKLSFGLNIFQSDGSEIASIAPGELGEAAESLQKTYVAKVLSSAPIAVSIKKTGSSIIWNSENLDIKKLDRRADWTQVVSDWWAPKLMSILGMPITTEPIQSRQSYLSGGTEFLAEIRATSEVLPDIATRAFGWLTVAFFIIVCLSLFGVIGVTRLFSLTRTAWKLTKDESQLIDKRQFRNAKRSRDEISTLGRMITSLVSRSRSRNALVRKQAAQRNQELRLAQELLKLRHDRLDVIGHEIRSPLAALLNQTEDQPELQSQLKKMHRAVQTLLHAETVEDGIKSLEVVPVRSDIAKFLQTYVSNKRSTVPYLKYVGVQEGLFATADLMQLEAVVEHLVDNAETYRTGGDVVITLQGQEPTITVFNIGPQIEGDRLETIFKYKNSDGLLPRNRGIGLYASRSYLIGMQATIRATNVEGGVAMIIALTPSD